jgi:outer membrane protein assembly factor BamE (lipoprotein component of BamABCDE complex)
MPKAGSSLLLLLLAASLAGCANFTAVTSGMPAQQVQAKLGAPETVRKNSDGSEVWEYPGGPFGRQTYMVTVGADRTVREVHQVLNDEYFSRVRAGMSRDEVRRLLGRPAEIMVFGARDEEVWSWRYQQQNAMFFNVLFDRSAGTVRTTQRLEEILLMDRDC